MAARDLAQAIAAVRIRAHRAEQAEVEEEETAPHDPGDIDHDREDEADMDGLEDAARRSRDASLSRAQLVDFAAQRGVRLSREEQAAPMDALRKVVLDRLAALAAG